MDIKSRVLIGIASLSLILMYVTPIWKITLDAPQYPEGLGLEIWIDNIVGQKEHDLNNVNNLNHYIGMKRIEPDSIKELEVMPWIIGGLIGLGLLVAAAGKRWLLYTWLALFIGISIVGLYDFYLWEYDYGHNLDEEHAIIKIPGMNYQPPLIGSKQLLNFVATSWPAFGGIVAFLVMGVGMFVSYREFKLSRLSVAGSNATAVVLAGLMLFSGVATSGCTPEPQPIKENIDSCAHCKMSVSDLRYGAEILLTTGKALKFDAIECMAAFLSEDGVNEEMIHSLWVMDFSTPGTLIPVTEAHFLHSPELSSPMGMNLTSFKPEADLSASFAGKLLEWDAVLELVKSDDMHAHGS